ncbi:hypothetical protein O181_011775 [Austropuccinia psidii MF-1]|uniref:Uncharacterized protein n=1 Tax=Austropuccinia psidii MF-1 TaxID=1389203 RepID=A0A9Q3GM87_9BASI|nr:hypothetical protein [Austropuccinia psidii MF-1]
MRGFHRVREIQYDPPTPQRPVLMEHMRQDIQPQIWLAQTRGNLQESFSKRYPSTNSWGLQKRWNHKRNSILLEEREDNIRTNQPTIQAM